MSPIINNFGLGSFVSTKPANNDSICPIEAQFYQFCVFATLCRAGVALVCVEMAEPSSSCTADEETAAAIRAAYDRIKNMPIDEAPGSELCFVQRYAQDNSIATESEARLSPPARCC